MNVSTSGGQGSFNAQAPSPVTIGGTTYAFSSWVADGSAQLQGTIGTTGCFNNLGNGQTSITANYVATVNTTTTVASSANPSAFGQAVTFTATVTPASGATNPTGTVQFKVDGADFGTPVSLTPGTGNTSVATSSSTSTLSVAGSPHVITAVYSPTGAFNASTGTLNQTVNKANTATSLASSANPSKFGQSVTFTATVARIPAGSGTPTGTVTFKEGATTLGTGTLNGSGVATFTTSTLSVGSHSITAEYRRRRKLQHEHVQRTNAGSAEIRHQHCAVLVGEPVHVRPVGHVHSDRDGNRARDRNSRGLGGVLRWRDVVWERAP